MAQRWNYRCTGDYGLIAYHPETGEVEKQNLKIVGAKLSDEGKTLTLQVPQLRPVDQSHLRLNLIDAAGQAFAEDIYWTIHAIPTKP